MNNIGRVCQDCLKEQYDEFQKNFPDLLLGDYVKTTFSRADGATESMWVQVRTMTDETISGTLANDPVIVNMKEGDPVTVLKSKIWDHLR